MTMDLRINRVRVIVNNENIVVAEPRRGYFCLLDQPRNLDGKSNGISGLILFAENEV